MNWHVTIPPTGPLLSWDKLSAHLRIDDGNVSEREYVMDLLNTAVAYAEEKLNACLMPQTIAATFYASDELYLPRGPMIAIGSVKDANDASVSYEAVTTGFRTFVFPKSAAVYPVTVTYQAGYAAVPADIIGVIRVHVATLYQHREAHSERSVNDVHKLDEFYRFRSHVSPVR